MIALIKKELKLIFITPVAYIFGSIFIMTTMLLTFYFGKFFDRGVADLTIFFSYFPWVFIFFVSAITMKSWAEEKKLGTIELLFTLPFNTYQLVLSKFLSIWLYVSVIVMLTFPIWISVNYLGNPDNYLIFGQYIGTILMAGSYISLGVFFSSITNNQIIAFISSVLFLFIFTVSGFPILIGFLSDYLPLEIVELISGFSFTTHFYSLQKGYLSLKSIYFFISFIVLWNFLTILVFNRKQ